MMKTKKEKSTRNALKAKCGLCGKTRNIMKTECCSNWICDDEHRYAMFSYARNSCYRNHSHYTLCAHHHNEQHPGNWQECIECKSDFATEIYVWYGTNEYNFNKLTNPPEYEPTKCSACGAIIVLSEGGYSTLSKQYFCEECSEKRIKERLQHSGDPEH